MRIAFEFFLETDGRALWLDQIRFGTFKHSLCDLIRALLIAFLPAFQYVFARCAINFNIL
jgi:hypothetical protein